MSINRNLNSSEPNIIHSADSLKLPNIHQNAAIVAPQKSENIFYAENPLRFSRAIGSPAMLISPYRNVPNFARKSATKSHLRTEEVLRIKSPDLSNISPRIDNRWKNNFKSYLTHKNVNAVDADGLFTNRRKRASLPILKPLVAVHEGYSAGQNAFLPGQFNSSGNSIVRFNFYQS